MQDEPQAASGGNNGRRRSSAALAAVSGQGAPGRKGSIFEGMQVHLSMDFFPSDKCLSRRPVRVTIFFPRVCSVVRTELYCTVL